MKTILISLWLLFASSALLAQGDLTSVLSSVEENNTTLKSLREAAEAQKLENKTGIFLSDPEVGFNYLWGSPANIGNRTDLSVTQSFDIPTLTGMKNRFANEQNSLVEWQYKTDRMAVLLEAKQYALELVYYNALKKELDIRLQHAETLAAGYKVRINTGDANRLEYNKAMLNLSTVQGEMSRVEVERTALQEQLKRLNGGIAILLGDERFAPVELPSDFDFWYVEAEQRSPVLAYVKQEIEVGKKNVSLSKAMGLPTFSTGYMSEKIVGERFQGISVGVSIPLWGNKNRVKQAKAAARAAEWRQTDARQQFYSQLQLLYKRAWGLKIIADMHRKSLETANHTGLLKKALDAGEISLLDYIVETGLYYDTVNRLLEAERDYQKAFAELSAVEL